MSEREMAESLGAGLRRDSEREMEESAGRRLGFLFVFFGKKGLGHRGGGQ